MDGSLKQVIEIASSRGSKYIKGDVSIEELPEKIAEMGIFLLSRVNNLKEFKGGKMREELNEIQNKLDDLRKALFYSKGKITNS